jgi:hypothetical protein
MREREAAGLRCQIFIEQRRGGTVWVPYKILIGYAVGNRVIIGSKGEQLTFNQAFATRDAAEDAAKRRAWETIREKFPAVQRHEVGWDLVMEGIGAFVPA